MVIFRRPFSSFSRHSDKATFKIFCHLNGFLRLFFLRKHFTDKGESCSEKLASGVCHSFLQGHPFRFSLHLCSLTFIDWNNRFCSKKHLQSPFQLIHAACKMNCIDTGFRIEGGQGKIVFCRKGSQKFFFQRLFGDKEKGLDRSLLAHPMDTGDPLFKDSGIPGEVYVDDCIGSLEIEAYCSGIGRDKEFEVPALFETGKLSPVFSSGGQNRLTGRSSVYVLKARGSIKLSMVVHSEKRTIFRSSSSTS